MLHPQWLEDADAEFVKVLAKNEADRFGMVHLGDQLYADAVARFAATLSVPDNDSAHAVYAGALVAFRDLYRCIWSICVIACALEGIRGHGELDVFLLSI